MKKTNNTQNLSTIRYIFNEFFSKGNLRAYEQIVREDIKIHCPKSFKTFHAYEVKGRASTKEIDEAYSKAFVYQKVEIETIISDGDKFVVPWNAKGHHLHDFYSIKASHRPFSFTGQSTYRFDTYGRIFEVWQLWDLLGLLQQISEVNISSSAISKPEMMHLYKKASLLTRREKECLHLFLQGGTAQDTGDKLLLSRRTVEFYFENIKNKLCCFRKKELFQIAQLLAKHNLL